MKFSYLILIICLTFINLNAQDSVEEQEVLGLAYNLFAVKAQKLEQSKPYGHCRIPGGILLDPRKSYSNTFEKDEYFSDNAKILKENEVFQLPGYFRMSKIYRSDIENYFIATKIANQWTNHSFEEILEYENLSQGEEIGCPQCNFHKVYYNDRDNCAVSVFYQIFPLRSKDKLEYQESITGQNEGIESSEIVKEEKDLKKLKSKNKSEKKALSKERKALLKKTNKALEKQENARNSKVAKKSSKSNNDKKILSNTARLRQLQIEKDKLENQASNCEHCNHFKEIAGKLSKDPTENFIEKDKNWINYYKCQISCFELMDTANSTTRLIKVKASLERYKTIAKIRNQGLN